MKILDQTGYELNLDLLNTVLKNELRIVSVVPSQTELLYDLGLKNQIVGLTKFCTEPQELEESNQKWLEIKTKIGGTKNIDIEKYDNCIKSSRNVINFSKKRYIRPRYH